MSQRSYVDMLDVDLTPALLDVLATFRRELGTPESPSEMSIEDELRDISDWEVRLAFLMRAAAWGGEFVPTHQGALDAFSAALEASTQGGKLTEADRESAGDLKDALWLRKEKLSPTSKAQIETWLDETQLHPSVRADAKRYLRTGVVDDRRGDADSGLSNLDRS